MINRYDNAYDDSSLMNNIKFIVEFYSSESQPVSVAFGILRFKSKLIWDFQQISN